MKIITSIKRMMLVSAVMLTTATAHADMDSYLIVGNNDTLWISPSCVGGIADAKVHSVFTGRVDFWYMTLTYEGGIFPLSATAGPDMTVPYINSTGHDTTYTAQLNHGYDFGQSQSIAWSRISIPGYWDSNNDGYYEWYGTVKWEAGSYSDMFTLHLSVPGDFIEGSITFNGQLNSGDDMRGGGTGPLVFYKIVHCLVGYEPGDVNGDGLVSVLDVTTLISYLLGNDEIPFDNYNRSAADLNRDGNVSINDVTALIDRLLTE